MLGVGDVHRDTEPGVTGGIGRGRASFRSRPVLLAGPAAGVRASASGTPCQLVDATRAVVFCAALVRDGSAGRRLVTSTSTDGGRTWRTAPASGVAVTAGRAVVPQRGQWPVRAPAVVRPGQRGAGLPERPHRGGWRTAVGPRGGGRRLRGRVLLDRRRYPLVPGVSALRRDPRPRRARRERRAGPRAVAAGARVVVADTDRHLPRRRADDLREEMQRHLDAAIGTKGHEYYSRTS